MPMIKFSLVIRYSNILTTITNHKIEQLKQYTVIKVVYCPVPSCDAVRLQQACVRR